LHEDVLFEKKFAEQFMAFTVADRINIGDTGAFLS